jgi:membrane-associated protease RseP (regulator of RpoE activity)
MKVESNRWCVVAACLLLLSGGRAHAQAQDKPYNLEDKDGFVVPFSYDPPAMPWIVVQVSINDKPPMPFIVDTGFSVALVVDTEAAKKLDLHPTQKKITLEQGGITLVETPIQSAYLAGQEPNDKAELALKIAYQCDLRLFNNAYGGARIAGVIGGPVLSEVTTRIDFEASTLMLFTSAHPPLHIPGAATLPVRRRGLDYRYNVTIAPKAGVSADLMLDTGSMGTVLPEAVAASLQPSDAISGWSATLYALYLGNTLLLPNLKVGEYIEPKVTVDTTMTPSQAVMGLDLLSRFRVTLDFRNGFMTLERRADYARCLRMDGWTGIKLTQRQGHYYADDVRNGSPAQKAGITTGDRIVRVDGRALDDLPDLVADRIQSGYAYTRAELLLERKDGKHLTVHCQRESAFENPINPRLGMDAERRNGSPMTVQSVLPGFAAEKAGLRAGDTIIGMNGHPTAAITIEQVRAAMYLPEITLQVRRKGEEKLHTVQLKQR